MRVSFEIVPPLTGIRIDELLTTVGELMEFAPSAINVTCHRDEFEFVSKPDGSFERRLTKSRISPADVCAAILGKYDVNMVPHLICGGNTAADIDSLLASFRELGVSEVMALRGDSVAGERRFSPTPGGYAHADELVAAVRRAGGFKIGVGGYPEKHFEAANLDADIRNLRRKVDAGADYVITQMFFDNAVYYSFVEKCRAAGITVPIIPGLKPLSTLRQVELLPEAFSIDIPEDLASAVADASRSADPREAVYRVGMQWCTAQCRDLAARGVEAIHLYTMGKTRNITEILRNL
ncbi:MAG: methylenetetrahydrofolate reductase [Bacteroidales bacterium]|nr:methylenetetrahydrofolate reductase [Bacteroidales bacterium]